MEKLTRIIHRYRPAFFSGFPPEQEEFVSTEQMLNIPWIKQWEDSPGFMEFQTSRECLMAIMENGEKWWVIARGNFNLDEDEDIDLPIWKYNKK